MMRELADDERKSMNRVVETPYGYDCIVGGTRFGTWRSRAEAAGGMVVEHRRAIERAAKEPIDPEEGESEPEPEKEEMDLEAARLDAIRYEQDYERGCDA